MKNKKTVTALLAGVCVMSSCKNAVGTLKIIAPGVAVSLNNPEITEFVDDYYFGKSLGYIDKAKGDRYFPTAVGVEWTGDADGNYELTTALSEDFSDSVTCEVKGLKTEISGLLTGRTYYCKVKSAADGKESGVKKITTARGPRTVKIDGVSNTRDIGGYAVSGGETKQGSIYRGATPENISAAGLRQFKALGIKTIIDLREKPERKETLPGVKYIDLPERGGPCYVRGDRSLTEEPFTSALVKSVGVFADENNYPVYFHCQIGRDRTGTLAFIINGLLGANENDLALDYELSCFSAAGCVDYDDKNKQIENMTANFKSMTTYFLKYSKLKGNKTPDIKSGIEAFLIDNGVTEKEIAEIRRILVV